MNHLAVRSNCHSAFRLIDGIQSFTSQLSVIGENPKEFATLLNRTADLIHALANMNSSAGSKLRFEEVSECCCCSLLLLILAVTQRGALVLPGRVCAAS